MFALVKMQAQPAYELHLKKLLDNEQLSTAQIDTINKANDSLIRVFPVSQNFKAMLFQIKKWCTDRNYPAGMADAQFNIGRYYIKEYKTALALQYYLVALSINEKLKDKHQQARTLFQIGIIYHQQKNFLAALGYFSHSSALFNQLGEKYRQSLSYYLLGVVYTELDNFDSAKVNFTRGINLKLILKDEVGLTESYTEMAKMYIKEKKPDSALALVNKSLQLKLVMNDCDDFLSIKNKIEAEALLLKQKPKLAVAPSLACLQFALSTQNPDLILEGYLIAFKAADATGNYKDAYHFQSKYLKLKDSLFSLEGAQKLNTIDENYHIDKKQSEINLLRENKVLQSILIDSFLVAIVLLILVVFLLFNRNRLRQRANNSITKEKERSDHLLLNMLPAEIAEELKRTGQTVAKQYDNVTVLFTDFVGFTIISEKLSPTELVAEIHHCFSAFDKIIEQNGLEKIKTIGDAYLAVSGMPMENKEHAKKAVKAAIEIQDFINKRQIEGGKFKIRIGIHSGSVIAGIVGIKKFAYDIWGDTVNTACSMEQNSIPGKINISRSTYELVKNDYPCTYRGKITPKNKGQMDMYFVE